MAGLIIGDTPEQLGKITAADAIIVDGKIVTKADYLALSAQVGVLKAAAQQLSFEIAHDPSEPEFKSFGRLQDVMASTPTACLAQVQAEAGRAGFLAGSRVDSQTMSEDEFYKAVDEYTVNILNRGGSYE